MEKRKRGLKLKNDKWCTVKLLTIYPQAVNSAPQSAPTILHGVWHSVLCLWPVWVSCPGHAASWIVGRLLTGKAWETGKTLTKGMHYSAKAEASLLSRSLSFYGQKPQHCTSYRKETNSIPSKTKTYSKKLWGNCHILKVKKKKACLNYWDFYQYF